MRIRAAVPVVALVMMLLAAPVSAATKVVEIKSSAFVPTTVTAAMGDTVSWTNKDGFLHSATGNAPLSLWGFDVPAGQGKARTFKQAGTFPYHCRIHGSMQGAVKVPTKASPGSGTASTTFTIRVATITAPSGFTYVIQRKAPGGSYQAWKTTTAQTVTFKSSTKGTWRFRSQLKKTSNGAKSGFSPAASVTIT